MKKIVLILLSLTVCIFLPAQPQLRFQNFDTRNGLSHYQVRSLMVDSKGFLWVGTEFGLNRFDGVEFEKWFHIPNDTTSLLHNKIFNTTEDQQQRILIATEKGISIYDIARGKFKSYQQIPTENGGNIALEQPIVFSDNDGDIWIGTAKGSAILYKAATNKFYNIPLQLTPAGRIQNNFVAAFLQDRKNRIWVSTSYGIYKIDKPGLRATTYRLDESIPNGSLLNSGIGLFETQMGLLLCGTWNAGFMIFDEEHDTFRPINSPEGPFMPSTVVFNFGQHQNTIFFATISGLFSCEEKDLSIPGFKEYRMYAVDPNDPFSIASTVNNSILSDRVGNLWVGGSRGVSLLSSHYKYYTSFSFNDISPAQDGLPISIEQNGEQLLVAVNNEVLIFDLQNERFEKTKFNIHDFGLHRFIKSGKHYYQPSQSALLKYDESLRLIDIINEKTPDGRSMNIYNAMEDSKGNLWKVTSRYGLRKYDVNGTVIPFLHDTTQTIHSVGSIIGSIVESEMGNIYAGGKELFILKKDSDAFESIPILHENARNDIWALKISGDILWIGTRNGLYNYQENNGTVKHLNLPAEVNQAIEEIETDDMGNLWMVTSSGLIKYNPADTTTVVFNDKNGWPRMMYAIKALDDGRIAIGSTGEIIIIDPSEIKPETYSPQPSITELIIDETTSFLMPQSDTTFRLTYNQSIRFNYISLTYHNALNNKYAWQLKGLDDRWHNAGNLTSQVFATLAPGRYDFSIKSANANNIWSDAVTTISFIVMPPFYKTSWFIILMVLVIAGIIYALYRYRLQKALQIERMRTRIATDLHDDIGATLSSISFYSEAVNQKTKGKMPEVSPILEKMGETSRTMVSSMSDIVWAINPLNDDMGKTLERMQSYAKELGAIKEKVIHVSIDEKVHHLKPQLEQRRNIYLIFKEALNNALKYADCTEIRISVALKGNVFHLQIADDGKGFDNSIEGEGNGIKNMQRRAADIGATIKIWSAESKGTVIDLELAI